MYRTILFLLTALVLSACVAVETYREETEAGIVYYLPKTLLDVTVTPYRFASGKGGLAYFDIAVAPKHVADIRQRLVFRYRPNSLFDDRLCAAVGDDNLLKSIEVATDDRTPEIIVSIARLAARILADPFAAAPEGDARRTQAVPAEKFEMVVDPLSTADIAAFNNAASRHFYGKPGNMSLAIRDIGYLADDGANPCEQDEICYRTSVSMPVTLSTPKGDAVAYASVISQRETGRIKIERAVFVEKISKFQFTGGVLRAMAIKKPSETLAAVRLPLTVLDAVLVSVLSAPSNAIGTALSGLSPAEKNELLKSVQANAKDVATLSADLKRIRDEGITEIADTQIGFTCTLPNSN